MQRVLKTLVIAAVVLAGLVAMALSLGFTWWRPDTTADWLLLVFLGIPA